MLQTEATKSVAVFQSLTKSRTMGWVVAERVTGKSDSDSKVTRNVPNDRE